MDFDPFSQLSLDPFPPGGMGGSGPIAPAPATPPPPVPMSDDNAATMGGGGGMGYFPGATTTTTTTTTAATTTMNAGGGQRHLLPQQHHQQHHLQPMQVTPDQVAVVHEQGASHPSSYSNHPLDAFDRMAPGPLTHHQQRQHHQQQHTTTMSPPQSTNSFDYNMAVVANNTLTSPPISPLWTPASPNLSPMGGGAAPANNSNVASNFPMPTFGTISPPAPNPFDLFDVAQPAAPAQSSSAPAAQAGDPFADGDALLLPIPPQRQIASGLQRRQDDDDAANDFWKDMGFGLPPPSINSGNSRGDRRGGGVDVARGGATATTAAAPATAPTPTRTTTTTATATTTKTTGTTGRGAAAPATTPPCPSTAEACPRGGSTTPRA